MLKYILCFARARVNIYIFVPIMEQNEMNQTILMTFSQYKQYQIDKKMDVKDTTPNGRYGRLARAKEYGSQHGFTPLTQEETAQFWQSIADCTNL